jgi:hypothetical protein
MKVHLLWRDRDVDFTVVRSRRYYQVEGPELSPTQQDLIRDLELDTLFDAMGGGDAVLREISRRVLVAPLRSPEEILYRQAILVDCLANRDTIKEMLACAIDAVDAEGQIWGSLFNRPESILRRSIDALQIFVACLKRLRRVAERHAEQFSSEGFSVFFSMIKEELDDGYFALVDEHLDRLKFRGGVLMSARFGQGLKGVDYVLRTPEASKVSLKERIGMAPRTEYHWDLPPRDEAGGRALSELSGRGVNLVANALAQSTDHIKSFLVMLWIELGFYAACSNLHDALSSRGQPVCLPEPVPWDPPRLSYSGIYEPCLALHSSEPVVDNDADGSGKTLVVITGANSGGKSTLLRAIGVAQLMTQAGMYVAGRSYQASVSAGLFSHFIREEDETMKSGKLDEELVRMKAVAGQLRPGCVVLFNESFAATNEREGSEIAADIVRALLDSGVRALFVTHQYTLARYFYEHRRDTTLFLRAERTEGGGRTYKLRPAEPLRTSFGKDLYQRIGGW